MDRGVLGDPLSTTNYSVNCGEPKAIVRGVSWLSIVCYKNIELTPTTRQLHSRELCAAATLRSARPTQSKVRVSPTSHTFLLHEHGAVTHRAASGVAFVRVLSPVEQRRVADEEKAGQETRACEITRANSRWLSLQVWFDERDARVDGVLI